MQLYAKYLRNVWIFVHTRYQQAQCLNDLPEVLRYRTIWYHLFIYLFICSNMIEHKTILLKQLHDQDNKAAINSADSCPGSIFRPTNFRCTAEYKVKWSYTWLWALGTELIPVYWQSGCRWLRHKLGGTLLLLSTSPAPAFTFPAKEITPLAGTKLCYLVKEAHRLSSLPKATT